MFRSLYRKWFARPSRIIRTRTARLTVEPFEDRLVPSTVKVTFNDPSNLFGSHEAQAQAIVQTAAHDWQAVIKDFHQQDPNNGGKDTNELDIDVTAYSTYQNWSAQNGLTSSGIPVTSNNLGGYGGYTDPGDLDPNGVPLKGHLALWVAPGGAGWSFSGASTDGSAAVSNAGFTPDPRDLSFSGTPSQTGTDLLTTVLHEMGHIVAGVQQFPAGAIPDVMSAPGSGAPFPVHAPSGTPYYDSYVPMNGQASPIYLYPLDNGTGEVVALDQYFHVFASHGLEPTKPVNAAYVEDPGLPGRIDLMNPYTDNGRRSLISDTDAWVLEKWRGYSVALPSNLGGPWTIGNLSPAPPIYGASSDSNGGAGSFVPMSYQVGASVANGVLTIDTTALDQGQGDSVAIDQAADGSILFTIDGLTSSYDAGALNGINITTGPGANTVQVLHTPWWVPVTLNAGGQDVVSLGAGGQLATAAGGVTIDGGGRGAVTLNLNDAGDAGANAGTIGNGYVDLGGSWNAFGAGDLQALNVTTGTGVNTIDVDDVGSATGVTNLVMAGSIGTDANGQPGHDTVHVLGSDSYLKVEGQAGQLTVDVGSAGSLANLQDDVHVRSDAGSAALNIDDSGDHTSPQGTLGAGALTGLSAGWITWEPTSAGGGTVAPTVALGSGTLTVNATGAQPTTVNAAAANVNVLGTGSGGLTVNATAGAFVQVGQGSVQQINGTVGVTSPDDTGRLVVAAYNDAGRSATLTQYAGTTVNLAALGGLAPASIDYLSSQLGAATIDLGPNEALTVTGAQGLDGLGGLMVYGSSGNTLTLDDHAGTGLSGALPAGATAVQSAVAYTLTAGDVQRGSSFHYQAAVPAGGAALVNFSYQNVANLVLDGTDRGATFTVQGGPAATTLRGGAGNDTFRLQTTLGSSSGVTVDGGAGSNTLDYSPYQGNVTVNLRPGTATGLAGLSHVTNVVGSQGNDLLIGDGKGDVLTGGTGRNLLIAGPGKATLVGNAGEDILVGGDTRYDADPTLAGLNAVMAEWARTDLPYAARVNHLLGGGGLNGNTLLNAAAFTSNGGGNTLTGGAGLDLFYGLLPGDAGTPDVTDWNGGQGEIFIDPRGEQFGVAFRLVNVTAPGLLLDGTRAITPSTGTMALQPGDHSIYGAGGTDAFWIHVNADGTISFDASLQRFLSGQGMRQLTLTGAPVMINLTSLALPSVVLDYAVTEPAAKSFTAWLLPGSHTLYGPGGTGAVGFTVDAYGDVQYTQPAGSTLFGGQGTSTLAVNGIAVTIDATALGLPGVLMDYSVTQNATKPFTVWMMPGSHLLETPSGRAVGFTLAADGTITFASALNGVLSSPGKGSLRVIAQAI